MAQLRILPIFSAWSPARSMSFETFFDVFANCLLASPTVFATDLASTAGRCLGIGTPSHVLRRPRLLMTSPPAMPAAAAPTASAGPLAFVATCLIASVTPPWLPLPLLLAVARVEALRLAEERDFAAALRPLDFAVLRLPPDFAVLRLPFVFAVVRLPFGFAALRVADDPLRPLAVFARVPEDLFAPLDARLLVDRFALLVLGLLSAISPPLVEICY
jgi:hypothetical protein